MAHHILHLIEKGESEILDFKKTINGTSGLIILEFTAQASPSRLIVESGQPNATWFVDNVKVVDITDDAQGDGYKFSFNGKEKDNETYGDGNEYDYGARIYSPRLGKFFSIDPLFKVFTYNSPYLFADNNPIWKIDLDGNQSKKANELTVDVNKPKFSLSNEQNVKVNAEIKVSSLIQGLIVRDFIAIAYPDLLKDSKQAKEVEKTLTNRIEVAVNNNQVKMKIDLRTSSEKQGDKSLVSQVYNMTLDMGKDELKTDLTEGVFEFVNGAFKTSINSAQVAGTLIAVFTPVETGKGASANNSTQEVIQKREDAIVSHVRRALSATPSAINEKIDKELKSADSKQDNTQVKGK